MASRARFVGWIWAVDVVRSDGGIDQVQIDWTPVAVLPGGGLVTGASRRAVEAGRGFSRPAGARSAKCAEVWYFRERPEGDWWRHELIGARVCTFEAAGKVRCWLSAPHSRICDGPGDFICER